MKSPEITIRVALPHTPYDICTGTNLLPDLAGWLLQWCPDCRHAVIVTDEIVEPLYALAAGETLVEAGIEVDMCVVPAGEQSKSVEMADVLWQQLIESGTDRRSVLLAVGGGVVGDLAGFVAATLNRGIRFIQVPTTLLAQVDSSVGGKVGINIPQGKNLVGAFLQPKGVLIDMKTLQTLDDRQFCAGLAEVAKYGIILDANFFAFLEKNADAILARKPEVMVQVIARCCELKAMIVGQDERETTGRRAMLNYGHTYGHAVEKLGGYGRVLHGEAVAIGMTAAARLTQILTESKTLPEDEKAAKLDAIHDLETRQSALLQKWRLPVTFPRHAVTDILNVMLRDKKTLGGKFSFILPERLGSCVLQTVDDESAILTAAESLMKE